MRSSRFLALGFPIPDNSMTESSERRLRPAVGERTLESVPASKEVNEVGGWKKV
jgi:hypothetical protein